MRTQKPSQLLSRNWGVILGGNDTKMVKPRGKATLIAGPTASGKSALALKIAAEKDAVIVNADSMQVYGVLKVLTARPSEAEEIQAPHFLYGHRDPAEEYSTGHWLKEVASCLDRIDPARHVVFVGGTGLYFRALLGGLSPMPEIDEGVREGWRSRLIEEGAQSLHKILQEKDPQSAKLLNVSDGQRIVRALEIMETSGKSITWWQNQAGNALVDVDSIERLVIEPERVLLKERIHARFDQMMETGAIEEVKALLARRIDPSMPAMKAIGVHQIADYLAGAFEYSEAIELSKTATRQYAKRQMTWFRNQLTTGWTKLKI